MLAGHRLGEPPPAAAQRQRDRPGGRPRGARRRAATGHRRRRASDGPHSTPAAATATGSSTRAVSRGSQAADQHVSAAQVQVAAVPGERAADQPDDEHPDGDEDDEPAAGDAVRASGPLAASTSSRAAVISRRVCGRSAAEPDEPAGPCEHLYVATCPGLPGRRRPPLPRRGRVAALGALPAAGRLPGDRGRQRVDRRLRGDRRRARRDRRRPCRSGGSAPPRTPGSRPRRPTFVCFCDADGSMDPAQLPRVARPGARRRRPTSCSAGAARSRGAWPLHARVANVALARMLRAPHRAAAARPRPDARRPPRGAARPRHHRPAVRLPAGDGHPRRRRRLARPARSTSTTASAPRAAGPR